MKTYSILKIDGPPVWGEIPALEVSEVQWLPDRGIRMTQQMAYDATGLYLRQRAWERNLRMEITEPLGAVCEDSCMEFFFSPAADERYFNIECNPIGTIYFGFGAQRESRVRLILKDAKTRLSLETEQDMDGWEVRYHIPLSFIQMFYPEFQLEKGRRFTANCYKCGDKTDTPHYLAWNPMTSASPDFHRPGDFGEMILA